MTDDESKKTLYFAHPTGTYGTKAEARAIIYLKKLFPQYDIINPSSPQHQALILRDASYERKLVQRCDSLAYLPFSDDKIESNVATNIHAMLKKRGEVHELHVNELGIPNGMCSNITTYTPERALNKAESIAYNRDALATLKSPSQRERC